MYALNGGVLQDGDIKAEMLELLPGALNPYRRSSLTSRDRMDEVSSQRGPSVTARSRNNLRSSMRSGRKSSSAVVSDASNGQDGVHDATEPPIKHLPSCHRGAVNTVFRDPRNASHVVSAGNDGQMKWYTMKFISLEMLVYSLHSRSCVITEMLQAASLNILWKPAAGGTSKPSLKESMTWPKKRKLQSP